MPLVADIQNGVWGYRCAGQPSAKFMAYREHRKRWRRYEIDTRYRVEHLPDETQLAVWKLLNAGRPDGATRPAIEQIIGLHKAAEQSLFGPDDVAELRRIFNRVQNG